MRALLILPLLTLATVGCRKTVVHTSTSSAVRPDTLIAGTVIHSAGTWSAQTSKGSNELDLTVSGTAVNWSVKTEEKMGRFGSSSGTSGSGMSLSSPSDPWFIYVESPSRLWIFNGKDELNYNFSSLGGGGDSGTSISSGKLSSGGPPVPADLVPHLPPDLRKLFPEVEAAGKRPSL